MARVLFKKNFAEVLKTSILAVAIGKGDPSEQLGTLTDILLGANQEDADKFKDEITDTLKQLDGKAFRIGGAGASMETEGVISAG